jgi:hypothetical protein
MTAAVAAQPGAAPLTPAFQTVQAIPTVRQVPAGSCAATFASGQQCGGNMTNPTSNCTQFGSCDNEIWAGGCCPASLQCTALESSGNVCWSCGGKQTAALTTASESAGWCCCSCRAVHCSSHNACCRRCRQNSAGLVCDRSSLLAWKPAAALHSHRACHQHNDQHRTTC